MAHKDFVKVKVLDLPGVSGGCACSNPMPCTPEYAAMFQQKVAELKAALEESLSRPDRGGLHVTCGNIRRRKKANSGSFCPPRKYPSPLVVIDGEPKFAGSIQVKKIVKEVGAILG